MRLVPRRQPLVEELSQLSDLPPDRVLGEALRGNLSGVLKSVGGWIIRNLYEALFLHHIFYHDDKIISGDARHNSHPGQTTADPCSAG